MSKKTHSVELSLCLLTAIAIGVPANAQVSNFTGSGDGTSWIDSLNWDAGDPNGLTFDALIDGAAGTPFDVELTAYRLVNNLTVGSEDILRILNGDELEVATQIDNDGTIRLTSTSTNTGLRIETPVTLTGGGTILMEGGSARIADVSGTVDTGHLTIDTGSSILGQGFIGINRTILTNHGTIQASVVGGMLTIDPGTGGMVNDGVLESNQNSTLRLDSGTYTNTGGFIRVSDNATVELYSGPSIINGSLETTGTGIIETGNSTLATLTDVSLDGNIRINNGGNIELIGTLTTTSGSEVLIDSTVSNTDLLIETTVNLTGGGTISMAGAAARITDETGATDGHLVNNDFLIHGRGSIGTNRTQITNHSTIRADISGQTLNIDPDGDGLANDGLLEASNAATLRLSDGSYNNTNGTLRAQDGSTVELYAGPAITNGTLQTVGTGVIKTGNSTLSALTDVSLDGLLQIENGDNVELIGTLTATPSSIVRINSTVTNTDLLIEGLVNLTGGGTIEMLGAGPRILDETGTTDGHLVNNDFLIHGRGYIGYNRMQITNHDTIRADIAGQTLVIDPLSDVVNDGVMEATNTANLQLNNGNFDNTNGTIRAAADSTVEFLYGPSITNGTLQTTGNGLIHTGNATITTLTDVTLDGVVQIENGDNIELIGTLTTNPSSIVRINSTVSSTDLLIEGPVTLTGGGTIEMVGSGARILDESGSIDGHLTNTDMLIHGRGNIGYDRTQITNQSEIRADITDQTLELDPGTGGMVNTGLVNATNGATVLMNSGTYDNTGGTIRADVDSLVKFINGPVITAGTLQSIGTGRFETANATIAVLDSVTINGHVLIDNADNIELRGTVTNNAASLITVGSTVSTTDLLIESEVTLTGGGTIELIAGGSRILDESGVIDGHLKNMDNLIHGRGYIGYNRTQITNGGTIAADVSGQTLTLDVDARGLANTGTLRAIDTATLHIEDGFSNDGNIEVAADSTVRIDGTLTNNAGGVIFGNGLIQMDTGGNADVINDGEISPGASAGELAMDVGTLTFGATGSLTAEIGGLAAATDYDRLTVFGDVVLGGTLDASILGGFSPAVGDTFDILLASGSVSGSFDTINLPAGPGEGFGIFYGSNFVRLTVLRIQGDLNGDGYVGLDDLDIVLSNWNQNVPAGDVSSGDPSGDGYVGLDDLDLILGNWNGGTGFPSSPTPPTASASVPEPASALLLMTGIGALFSRRKR